MQLRDFKRGLNPLCSFNITALSGYFLAISNNAVYRFASKALRSSSDDSNSNLKDKLLIRHTGIAVSL